MEMELLDGRRALSRPTGLLTLVVAVLYANAVEGISGRPWCWEANAQKGMTTTAFSWLKANSLGIVLGLTQKFTSVGFSCSGLMTIWSGTAPCGRAPCVACSTGPKGMIAKALSLNSLAA